jgi:hypothetical protein
VKRVGDLKLASDMILSDSLGDEANEGSGFDQKTRGDKSAIISLLGWSVTVLMSGTNKGERQADNWVWNRG